MSDTQFPKKPTPQNIREKVIELMYSHVDSTDPRRHTNWSVPMLHGKLKSHFAYAKRYEKADFDNALTSELDRMLTDGILESKTTSKPGIQYALSADAIEVQNALHRAQSSGEAKPQPQSMVEFATVQSTLASYLNPQLADLIAKAILTKSTEKSR